MIWLACYESGDDYLGTASDIDRLIAWTGESNLVARELVACGRPEGHGFIEPTTAATDNETTFRVHDLWHHAPDYVQKRYRRELERKKRVIPTDKRRRTADTGRHRVPTSDWQIEVDRTLAPAPAPALALPQNVDPKSSETVSSVVRSSRAHDEPAKAITPNGNGQYPPPLIDGAEIRRHGQHRWCGRVCVTYAQHKEFARRIGKPEKDADAELTAWYPLHLAQFEGQVIGDPMFAFWNNGFAQKFGLVTRAPKNFETKGERTKRAFAEARAKLAEKSR